MSLQHGLIHLWRSAAAGSLAAQTAWLSGVVVLAWLLIAPLAWAISGLDGLKAEAVAAGICTFAAFGSLLLMKPLRGSAMVVTAVVAGTFLRIIVPLVFCFVVYMHDGPLVRAGMVFYVLAFYMVTLATDATLIAARVAAESRESKSV